MPIATFGYALSLHNQNKNEYFKAEAIFNNGMLRATFESLILNKLITSKIVAGVWDF
jgi:hypothetical protein